MPYTTPGTGGGTPLSPEAEATLEHWSYDPVKRHLVADVTAEFPPGSVLVGETLVSSALEVLSYTDHDGHTSLGLKDVYDDTGSDPLPVRFKLGPIDMLDVNLQTDYALPDPLFISYTTFGDNYTSGFMFISATSGEFRSLF